MTKSENPSPMTKDNAVTVTQGDVVERVATAIENVKGGLNYSYSDFCRDAARAAIAALATPLGVEAGQKPCGNCGFLPEKGGPE